MNLIKLRLILKANKMTASQISKRTGYSSGRISQWIHGKLPMPDDFKTALRLMQLQVPDFIGEFDWNE